MQIISSDLFILHIVVKQRKYTTYYSLFLNIRRFGSNLEGATGERSVFFRESGDRSLDQ
jgi:hypothetical protein